MPKTGYHRADEPGPGSGLFITLCGKRYQVIRGALSDPNRQVTFDEAVMIAQWINALTSFGTSRDEAEAAALERLKAFRQAKNFFGG